MVETVDALELEISTKSGGAADAVERLAASVSDLGKNVGSYIGDLNSLANALSSIAEAAGKLKGLGGLIGKISGATGAAKGAAGLTGAAAAAKKAGDDWKRSMFRSQKEYEDLFPRKERFAGQSPEKVHRAAASEAMRQEDVNRAAAMRTAREIQQMYGLGSRGMSAAAARQNGGYGPHPLPAKDIAEMVSQIRAGSGRYNGANQAWMTDEARAALSELSGMIVDRGRPSTGSDILDTLRAQAPLINVGGKDDREALASAGYTLAGLNSKYAQYGIRFTDQPGVGQPVEELKAFGGSLEHGTFTGNENATAGTLIKMMDDAIDERAKNFVGQYGYGQGRDAAQTNIANDLLGRILDIPVKGEPDKMSPDAQRVEEALRDQFIQNQSEAAGKLASDIVKENTIPASMGTQEMIDKNLGLTDEAREAAAEMRGDMMKSMAEGYVQGATVKGGMGTQEMIDQAHGLTDEARQSAAEIREGYMKSVAEGIVQSRTVGGGQGMQSFIDHQLGLDRPGQTREELVARGTAMEYALRERDADAMYARNKEIAEGIVGGKYGDPSRYGAFGQQMGLQDFINQQLGIDRPRQTQEELTARGMAMEQAFREQEAAAAYARNKEIAEGIVSGKYSDPAKFGQMAFPQRGSLQDIINQNLGIGRAPLSAEESAKGLLAGLEEREAKAAEARAAVDEARRAANASQRAEMEKLAAMPTATPEDKELANLQRFVENNTPEKLAEMREQYEHFNRSEGFQKMFEHVPMLADRAAEKGLIDENTANAMKEAAGFTQQVKDEASQAAPAVGEVKNAVQETGNAAGAAQGQTDGLKGALQDTSGQSGAMKDLSGNVKEVGDSAKEASENTVTLKSALSAAGKMIGKSIIGQLARVAKMRALRAIIRGIAAGFKEGMTNMYQWSDAMGGHFAKAMDTLKSKTTLAKNSIATAFGPAIEALMPTITTLIGWLNTACNALAQFFALLNGQTTWTKALETSEKWGKNTAGGAKKADDAMKDLLADWDELNIIQSQTGDSSGGGGGSGSNVKDMFTETNVFDEWTRHFQTVLDIVKLIGIGIAGWTLVGQAASFLKNIGFAADKVDGISSRVKKGIVGGVLLAVGFKLSEKAGEMYADEGFTWAAFVTQAIGVIAAGMGGAILASTFGINPVIGLALGIGLSIYATVSKYYGTLRENAKKYVKETLEQEVYKFDVEAVAENVKVKIDNVAGARKGAEEQLSTVLSTMDLLTLGIDEEHSWARLEDQVLNEDTGLIAKIKGRLAEEKNYMVFYYQFQQSPESGGMTRDGSGTNPALLMTFKANNYLEDWYTKQGKKLGQCFVDGETGQIKAGMEETALTIAQQIANAEAAAERGRSNARYRLSMAEHMRGTNKETVMQEWEGVIDENNRVLAEARRSADTTFYEIISGTLAELRETGASEELIEFYESQAAAAMQRLNDDNYALEVDLEFRAQNKEALMDFMHENFGEIPQEYLNEAVQNARAAVTTGVESSDSEIAESIKSAVFSGISYYYGINPAESELFSKTGFGIEDFLDETAIRQIAEEAIGMYGETEAVSIFAAMGISPGMMTRLFSPEALSTADLPEGFFTVEMPDESVEVDGRESGMAMDSTVGAASASAEKGMEKQNGLLERMTDIMRQVQTNTLATANKDFRVTVTPGSLVGAFVNRSQGAFGRVSG